MRLRQFIKSLIILIMGAAIVNMPAAAGLTAALTPKKILVVLTNHAAYPGRRDKTGVWLSELTHFYAAASDAGYELDFVSPEGGAAPLDERSLKNIYLDRTAKKYLSDPAFRRRLENTLAPSAVNPALYRAVYYVGGHGAVWDFASNRAIAAIAESIYAGGGLLIAVCHGVAGLLPLRDNNGMPLIRGKHLTGFSAREETLSGRRQVLPYILQDELLKQGADYKKALLPYTAYVVTDGRLITGQNPQSGGRLAKVAVAALEKLTTDTDKQKK